MDIEIVTYEEPGYKPVATYDKWRVAVLNDCEELEVSKLASMQKHCETDEIFVLLKGECTLFTAGKADEIGVISATKMEPLKIYNVKKGVWHTHTLEENSSVLIVENHDTCDANSPTLGLNQEQINRIQALYKS